MSNSNVYDFSRDKSAFLKAFLPFNGAVVVDRHLYICNLPLWLDTTNFN